MNASTSEKGVVDRLAAGSGVTMIYLVRGTFSKMIFRDIVYLEMDEGRQRKKARSRKAKHIERQLGEGD